MVRADQSGAPGLSGIDAHGHCVRDQDMNRFESMIVEAVNDHPGGHSRQRKETAPVPLKRGKGDGTLEPLPSRGRGDRGGIHGFAAGGGATAARGSSGRMRFVFHAAAISSRVRDQVSRFCAGSAFDEAISANPAGHGLVFPGGCGMLLRLDTLEQGSVGWFKYTPLVGQIYPATQWDIAMFKENPYFTGFGLDFPISLVTDTLFLPLDLTISLPELQQNARNRLESGEARWEARKSILKNAISGMTDQRNWSVWSSIRT